jgi:hypothetical protein
MTSFWQREMTKRRLSITTQRRIRVGSKCLRTLEKVWVAAAHAERSSHTSKGRERDNNNLESPPESSPPSIGRERTTTPNPRAHDDDTRRKQKQPKIKNKKNRKSKTRNPLPVGTGKKSQSWVITKKKRQTILSNYIGRGLNGNQTKWKWQSAKVGDNVLWQSPGRSLSIWRDGGEW